jgi:hypothetical protein
MTVIVIAFLFSMAQCGIALAANVRLRRADRLPMQWWLTGEVTWSAPRPLALAFIPGLAACVLGSLVLLSLNTVPRPGQEGMLLPTFIGIGVIFVAIQLLHLWLVEKTLRRDGS